MTELLVEMSFCCCLCEATTSFTVHCSGVGLDAGSRITLTAPVSCYCCGTYHDVAFHPTGEVVAAELREPGSRPLPVPSRN